MIKHILIIKHGALGDWILATGLFKQIRLFYPDANISLLTSPLYGELGRQSGYFDEVISDKRPSIFSTYYWKLIFSLRRHQFKLVFDFQNSSRTKRYFKLLNVNKNNWYSAKHNLGIHLESNKLHVLKKNALILSTANIQNFPAPDLTWLINHKTIQKPEKRYALLIPGCSVKHLNVKSWTYSGYRQVIEFLRQQNILPVIIGRGNDINIINDIIKDKDHILNLYNKTLLSDIAYLAKHAEFSIGSDTGTMHIAGILSPAIVFYAKGHSPALNRPWGDNIIPIKSDDLSLLSSLTVIKIISQFLKYAQLRKPVDILRYNCVN